MSNHTLALSRFFFSSLLCISLLFSIADAQKQGEPRTPQQPDDVIRITTELVQTDVTVLDKQGRFVDNLKREQFELLVDGKPQPITFFEKVKAGSTSEETQLAAARGNLTSQGTEVVRPLDRGRTIFFFLDDLHMAADSLIRTRNTLLQFIDKEMGQNDQVAITSTSGRIGFLQQLTDNKMVLRAAVSRLKSFAKLNDSTFPPMSESLALAIDAYNDRDVIRYFVQAMMLNNSPVSAPAGSARPITPDAPSGNQVGNQAAIAENMVRARAKRILQQAYNLTRSTLATLESLANSSAELSGRKLIFFISDGFLINRNESNMSDRIETITKASARSGVVIYTLDSRGLAVTGAGNAETVRLPAINQNDGDMQGVFSRYLTGELAATQEPLRIIAANTGGRALLNNNNLNASFTKAIQETSIYYLIAWRPENEAQLPDKFRQIEVRVSGRPDLDVQVRRGYYDVATKMTAKTVKVEAPPAPAKAGTKAKTAAEIALREAIGSPYPTTALPTQLGLVYVDTPDKGTVMTASIQIARQFMTFNHSEDKQTAIIDLTGVVLNDEGKPVASFKDRLDVAVYFPKYVGPPRRDLVYNFQSPLKPGLYQVRIATRDNKSGRTGSAMQWIEIPDLASRKLSLSSLLLGETTKDAESMKGGDSNAIAKSMLTVDRRLARTSKLRFMTYIYNAARGANGTAPPDVTLQVQIMRNDQPVITTVSRKIETGNAPDPARLPYAAEMPLEALPPGHYVLQITAIDRFAKATASQRANFEIE
jgi:VWFA-related protein